MIIRLSLWLLLCAALLAAGQVTLRNGDRLTGSIQKMDGKNLVFKSDLAGAVTIAWDAVTAISSEEPLRVGLKDGQMVAGAVGWSESRIIVRTKDAGEVTAAKDSVAFVRSKEEQAAYDAEIERYRNPRLVDLWTGFVDLGLAAAKGNSNTSNLSVSANASRATSRDKIGVYFTSLYANSDASGKSIVTANAMRGGVSYSLNVTSKVFAFGSTDLEFDEFQNLDLRFAPAGGVGYKALKTERATLDLLGGASLNREFFATGLNRTSGEGLAGEEFAYKFNARTSVREKFTVFPNITSSGDYRMNFDTSATTALFKWLAWQVTVSDRFLSNPVADRKKNDVLLTTGFRITFAR